MAVSLPVRTPEDVARGLLLLPSDRPFTTKEALARGVAARDLRLWVAAGRLCHPLRAVFHNADLPDSLALRMACLRLICPPDSVVTDRTAGWLLGAPMILAPGSNLVVPEPSIFLPPGRRLRNGIAHSGERRLAERDVMRVGDLWVTTPLRTACDLGRLLHPDQAIGAMDALAAVGGLDAGRIERELVRFKGYRGVVRARALAPHVDAASESPEESLVRFRWISVGRAPRPRLQVPVPSPGDSWFYLDIAAPEIGYAAEFDGKQWHGPRQQGIDLDRRDWIRTEFGYVIDVFTGDDVHGLHETASARLRYGFAAARESLSERAPLLARLNGLPAAPPRPRRRTG